MDKKFKRCEICAAELYNYENGLRVPARKRFCSDMCRAKGRRNDFELGLEDPLVPQSCQMCKGPMEMITRVFKLCAKCRTERYPNRSRRIYPSSELSTPTA